MTAPSNEPSDSDVMILLRDAVESMSETERRNLLDCLQRRRVHHRKLCIIPVDYRDAKGNNYHNFTLDIGLGGVFIETCEPHAVGQGLWLSLSLPAGTEAFQVSATVAWRGPNGVGVQFEGLSEEQKNTLYSIVEKL